MNSSLDLGKVAFKDVGLQVIIIIRYRYPFSVLRHSFVERLFLSIWLYKQI